MADDDEDARGASGPEDLLGPTGPRRSNFTPAPTDADSLEAANNVFGDDAIAAALAAELARVASGPIPVQKPAAPAVASAPPVNAPPAVTQQPPAEAVVPAVPLATDAQPSEAPVPTAVSEPVAVPAPVELPEPVNLPEPVAVPEPADVPEAIAAQQPESAPEPTLTQQTASASPPDVPSAPTVRPVVPPASPAGPPDWATSLFGQPTPTVRDEFSAPVQDPFAPSAPPFAPSSGPFPPPSEADADAAASTADADALRALYRGAPAPTVPPADAPPPPGYESTVSGETVASTGSADVRPRRRSLDDDELLRSVSDDAQPSDTRSAIEQLQAQLHLREQEAREFAVWESSMQAIGTPEALAEVARARAELAGEPVPAQPQAESVAAEFPTTPVAASVPTAPATPAEPLVTAAQASIDNPFATPDSQAAPAPSFAPPTDQPFVTLAPPKDELPFAAPPIAPQSELPPAELPPAEAPGVDFAQVEFPRVDSPPLESAPAEAAWNIELPPPSDEPSFPGFAPPTTEGSVDMYAAPADPRDLSFEPAPSAPVAPQATEPAGSQPESVLPDSPVFLEPPALVEPAAPAQADFARSDFGQPSSDQPSSDPLSPALTPLDGVADLYRSAGEFPVQDAVPAPPAPVPGSPVTEPPVTEPPFTDSAVPSPAAAPVAPSDAAPPVAPAVLPAGFDDLLSASGDDTPPLPAPVWSVPDPNLPSQPSAEEPEEHRPFGEGVERDDAVDPSDSIFGSAPGPVSVNTAGVAVVAAPVSLDSRPIRVLTPASEPAAAAPVVLTAPKVLPAEPVGLEPTPLEQRVGRSARLFWLWFAANSSIAAIIFGTIIFGLGVSLRQAIVATLAGVALSFIPLGLGTLAGKRSGQPTMVISRATFGVVGNILPALLALFSRLFWAAGLLWILGAGTSDILVGARLTDGFSGDQLTLIVMALGFVIAVVIAYFGYALIAIVQLVISIISGLAIIGFIALTVQYVDVGTALTVEDGPWILVVTGAVLVFSFVGLAWANSSADVARYQRPGSSGAASMLWATFGAALPSFVLICYGALLAASNSTLAHNIAANPLDSLGRLLPVWYPAPLLAATGLSLVSGVVLAMYSGGFALQAAGLRLRRSLSTLLVGVVVIAIAVGIALSITDFTQLLRDFATTIAVPIAAWAGIFCAEIMIRNRRFDSPSLLKRGGVYADVRWGNFAALIVISIIGLGFLSATVPALSWEGYLWNALGISVNSVVAQSDVGVLVALGLGLLVPAVVGIPAIRKQEKAERPSE